MSPLRDYADKRWLRSQPTPADHLAMGLAAARASMGERAATHPRSTFVYRGSRATDVRITFAAARNRRAG